MTDNGLALFIVLWSQSLWQGVLLQSIETKGGKTRCVSLLPSQSHKYIELKILFIVALEPPVTKVL